MRYVLFICADPTGEPYEERDDNIGERVGALQAKGKYVLGDRFAK